MVNTPQQNEEEIQLKEFLNRSEIKTMRKDLQKLRENIALKQRDRVIKVKTPEEQIIEKANADNARQEQEQKIAFEKQRIAQTKIIQNQTAEEQTAISQIKESATEEERQQIFYLETEKSNLEKELLTIQREKEPPLLLQKNKEMLERNALENELKIFEDEEQKLEKEQKFIDESEKNTNVTQDKKDLEQKRQRLEIERQKSEKKRWTVEKDLQASEEKTKFIEEGYQKLLAEQKILRDKITAINESIKNTYERIMLREQENIKAKKEQRDQEALARADIEAKKKEEIRRQERINKETPISQPAEESEMRKKLAQQMHKGAEEEENERQKFLKRIDEWAEEDRIHPVK